MKLSDDPQLVDDLVTAWRHTDWEGVALLLSFVRPELGRELELGLYDAGEVLERSTEINAFNITGRTTRLEWFNHLESIRAVIIQIGIEYTMTFEKYKSIYHMGENRNEATEQALFNPAETIDVITDDGRIYSYG